MTSEWLNVFERFSFIPLFQRERGLGLAYIHVVGYWELIALLELGHFGVHIFIDHRTVRMHLVRPRV